MDNAFNTVYWFLMGIRPGNDFSNEIKTSIRHARFCLWANWLRENNGK